MRRRLPLLRVLLVLAVAASLALPVAGQGEPRGDGRVYDENTDRLPPGCEEVSEDVAIEIRGGRIHAEGFPEATFSFDNRTFTVPSCARVTATFHNDDPVRHMWMVHDIWPNGTFLIEVDGPGSATGTFILGPEQRTLLFHCGMPQHQQKGMKGQLLVDGGLGDLPNILGISGLPPEAVDPFAEGTVPAGQEPEGSWRPAAATIALAALVAGLLWWRRKSA